MASERSESPTEARAEARTDLGAWLAEGIGAGNSADDEEEAPSRVIAKQADLGYNGGGMKHSAADRLAVAMQALQWGEDQEGTSAPEASLTGAGSGELQEECVGDFAREPEGPVGAMSKGKRGGRRSGDGDGRRRRSGDSDGRRRKSGDSDGRRRRSGDTRRPVESRKSGEGSRRSGESRRTAVSTGEWNGVLLCLRGTGRV